MKVPRRLEDPGWPGHLNDYALMVTAVAVFGSLAYFLPVFVLARLFGVDMGAANIAFLPIAVTCEFLFMRRRYARRSAYRRSRPWPLGLPPGHRTWGQTLDERRAVDPGMDARWAARDLSRLTPEDINDAARRVRGEE